MKTFEFYGHSDDLLVCTGPGYAEEVGCYQVPGVYRVASPGGASGLFVVGHYAPTGAGCWSVGVSPLDEDVPIPDWPIRISARGYTTVLQVDLPDDACVKPHGSED